MSMRDTQLPAYNPDMPQDQKEKVIQDSLRQIGQAMMAVGAKVVAQRTLTQGIIVGAAPVFPGTLTLGFTGSNGLMNFAVRIPFTLTGGATILKASLWVDDNEIDRNSSTSGQLTLNAQQLPPSGNHLLRVQLSTDAGTATLFASHAWGVISATETLL